MNPAFHQRQIALAGEAMVEETERALDGRRLRTDLDLYDRTRNLALRTALRALFGMNWRYTSRRARSGPQPLPLLP